MNNLCLGSQVSDYIIDECQRFTKSDEEAVSKLKRVEELGLLTQFWQEMKPRSARLPRGGAAI